VNRLRLFRASVPQDMQPHYKLKEQLAVITKHKSRKRKQIQQGGIMEYRTAAAQVAIKAFTVLQSLKKACSGGD
jgi:hypothetical protein